MADKANGFSPKKAEADGINKMECVRQAMSALGYDAGRVEIQSFVEKTFGFEMSLDVISTYKSDIARKAAKAKSVAKKPETPAPVAAAKKESGTKPRAKVTAVTPIKKPAGPAPVAKNPAVLTPKHKAKPSPTAGGNGDAGGGIGLADIKAVKDLVGRVGPDSLKTLVDVRAK